MQDNSRANSFVRIFAAVIVVLIVLGAAWLLGGRTLLESAVQKYSQPWANFDIPRESVPITGLQVTRMDDAITVCNRSSDEWKDVLLKTNEDYLSHLDKLRQGECRQIPVKNFTTASWKRMPPPREFRISSIEVLATVAKRGYGRGDVNR